jgi:DNA-binding transcriptional ArsR family regulator
MLKRENVSQAKKIGRLFHMLGQPARLRILMAIGKGEACVCHLEAVLGYRQAYISQHLMALRQMKLVRTRRDGRNIYYRLTDLEILHLLQEAGDLIGLEREEIRFSEAGAKVSNCPCPHCEPERADIPLTQVKRETVTSA